MAPKKLLLPKTSVVAPTDLNASVIDRLVIKSYDEVPKLAVELEFVGMSTNVVGG
jgi:hypothetical protein